VSNVNRGRFDGVNNIGRPYVKAGYGVPTNVNPGQWVRVAGQRKFSRLAANGLLVDPSGSRKAAEKTVSMSGFRLACNKNPRTVLRKGTPQAPPMTVEQLVDLCIS
jgi:hypothetical protein